MRVSFTTLLILVLGSIVPSLAAPIPFRRDTTATHITGMTADNGAICNGPYVIQVKASDCAKILNHTGFIEHFANRGCEPPRADSDAMGDCFKDSGD